jgi:simple sugar transport system ATP-binding protein
MGVEIMSTQYLLNMENISKEYYGNRVLKNVTLRVKPGEIHALIGENGAGKSTLMNILFGMPVIHATGGFEGTVEVEGKEVSIDAPHNAINYGIGMVHQEFMLIPGFTVTENIKVGREISKPTLVSRVLGASLETLDMEAMARDARKALKDIGLNIEEYATVAGLPVGHMQFIEIAREIDKTGIKLLVFDEPTAVLTESEAENLLQTMRLIAQKGIAIIFITHRLGEVMDYADNITVLRDGELVASKAVKDTNVLEIAELMIGRKVDSLVDPGEDTRTLADEDIAMSIRDLCVEMPGETVRGVDLDIRRGEIFGIGGLAGQGKLGIANGIMGLHRAWGSVGVFGQELALDKLGDALNKGVAFVSEDRRGVGLLLDESIEHNIVFSALQVQEDFLYKLGPVRLYNQAKARKHAKEMIDLLDIRCTGPSQAAGALSGGNQQKVCLARALTLRPKILIVAEPTRGIDIGAKKLVLEYLVKLNREQGLTIVVVSSELVELRSICDRIAIVSDGRVSEILRPEAPDAQFGLAMSGGKRGANCEC